MLSPTNHAHPRGHHRNQPTPRPIPKNCQRRTAATTPFSISRSRTLPASRLRHHARSRASAANALTGTNTGTLHQVHQGWILLRRQSAIRRRNLATVFPRTPHPRHRGFPKPTPLHRRQSPAPRPIRPPLRPHRMSITNRSHAG